MFYLNRKRKVAILVILDSCLIALSIIASLLFLSPFFPFDVQKFVEILIVTLALYLSIGSFFRIFTRINRYTNLREILAIFITTTIILFFEMGLSLVFQGIIYKRLIFLAYVLITFSIVGSRLAWRLYTELRQKPKDLIITNRALVIGAGEGGRILLSTFRHSSNQDTTEIIGILDDDENKWGTYLEGYKVLGEINQLASLVKEYEATMVVIAIPSLPKNRLKAIVEQAAGLNIKLSILPSMEDIAEGKISFSRLKNVEVTDLLGRDEVVLDIEQIKEKITNQTILVTGAGGSIGSEICRQVMRFNPKVLLLLGHGENSIYLINRELTTCYKNHETKIIPIIADIQDRNRISQVMAKYKPDIVYHAAAHKHVPMMEYNPTEAVKNNIFGTKNVAELAKQFNVKQFVMISTDKANNPPNVMGSTKRIAEMIVTGLNEPGKTKFSAVRFGNVLGSRGSVIPLFKEQLAKGGPLTVTDFRMTRYFMTIPEASRLVIQSGALAAGGEIFILDMGEPVKILDLAKNIIRLSGLSEKEVEIVETGIRPGEKLYEELLLDKERQDKQVYEKIFIGNIKGFTLTEVEDFINQLDLTNPSEVAKEVVAFANASNH